MILEPTAETFGLQPSLILPIAAKSRLSIEKYIGSITKDIANGKVFVIDFFPLCNSRELPVWNHERCHCLIQPKQIWVEVDYKDYRKAYLSECENGCIKSNDVIDHIMNRRLARELGYRFLRLLHVNRKVNSSSGRGGEFMAVDNLKIGKRINPDINRSEIVYADPMDLLKMLNVQVGGFGLDAVRDNHHLFYP
jgi:hypothetical protein